MASLDADFALLDQHIEAELLALNSRDTRPGFKEIKDEDRQLRAEKHYLRYVVVLYPRMYGRQVREDEMAPETILTDEQVAQLRVQKDALLPNNKSKRSRNPQHNCGRSCDWESLPGHLRNAPWIYDPCDPELGWCRASGLVFICATSGRAHLCGDNRCRRKTRQPTGELSCEISGRSFDSDILPSYTRDKLHASQRQKHDEQNDAGDETYVRTDMELLMHQEQQVQPSPGSAGSLDHSLYAEKKRKLADQAAMLATMASAVPKQPIRKREKQSRNRQIPDRSGAEQHSTLATMGDALLAEACKPRPPAPSMMDGSIFGRGRIQRSFEEIREASRKFAEQLCYEMFVSPAVDVHLHRKNAQAMQQAESLADRYIQETMRVGRQPDWLRIYECYMMFLSPLLEQTFSRYLPSGVASNSGYSDIHACRYFSEAILKIWKMLECTPRALEPRSHAPPGQLTKPHIQLRSIAMGILYRLRDGCFATIKYCTKTLCVLSEQRSQSHTDPVKEHRFCFIPPHEFLARLPNENEIAPLATQSGNNSGVFVNQRTIQSYYQSLVLQGLPLSTVHQYQLAAHMEIRYASELVRQQSSDILAQAKVVGTG